MYNNELISIITPAFNCERYIGKTIESVINQSYKNWEMIIVNDNSTDKTNEILQKYASIDSRVKYINLESNSGAAICRNKAMDTAKGKYLAFLDSDDIWNKDKLKIQINFMKKYDIAFSFTDYELIDDDGNKLNKVIKMPKSMNYNEYLKNTIIQTVTVMIDREKIIDYKMPLIRRRQDFACWLKILKGGNIAYSIPKVLAEYRRTTNSLSSNKIKAVKGTWYVYREIEKLSMINTIYVFIGYAFNACKKRIYIKRVVENLKPKRRDSKNQIY